MQRVSRRSLITVSYLRLSLTSATKLRRLCFYRRVSVHRGGGVCLSACWDTPPGADIPLGADTPSGSRHPREQTPLEQTAPPQQTPPRANLIPPPGADTPHPRETATAADGTHPTGMHSRFINWINSHLDYMLPCVASGVKKIWLSCACYFTIVT